MISRQARENKKQNQPKSHINLTDHNTNILAICDTEEEQNIYNIELLNNDTSQNEKLSLSPNTNLTYYNKIEEKHIYIYIYII